MLHFNLKKIINEIIFLLKGQIRQHSRMEDRKAKKALLLAVIK